MEFHEIYPLLTSYYEKAKTSKYIQNPVAWALYQVWKIADKSKFDTSIVFKPDGVHELDQCDFVEDAVYKNVTVQILKCKTCGRISIGWMLQNNTEEVESIEDLEQ